MVRDAVKVLKKDLFDLCWAEVKNHNNGNNNTIH